MLCLFLSLGCFLTVWAEESEIIKVTGTAEVYGLSRTPEEARYQALIAAREDAISKAVRRNESALSIPHFTPHDLRRTVASHMASAGVSRLVISKILNHVDSGVTAVYDRHSYDTDKRKALNSWARQLEAITSGKKASKIVRIK